MLRQKSFIFLLMVVATCNVIQPRGLVDEALKQLVELDSLVQGEILAAHNNIDESLETFGRYAINTNWATNQAFQIGQDSINQQLDEVKDAARAAAVDISTCTNVREDGLKKLPEKYGEQLAHCIAQTEQDTHKVVNDGKYTINIVFNKVYQLEDQINSCNGNLLCISPVLQEIELDKIRLPQNIRTETIETQSLVMGYRNIVYDCSTSKRAEYTAESNAILGDIIACANKIIG